MKGVLTAILSIALTLGFAAPSLPQTPRTTVMIVDFANRAGGWSGTAEAVTTRVIAKLREDPSLRVLPREQVKEALGQAKVETEGLIDWEAAQKVAKTLGADYVIMGEITTFDQQQKGGCLPVVGCVYTDTATVNLRAKVLGVAQGRFVAEPAAGATKQQGNASVYTGTWYGNVSLQNFDGQLIGKATIEAVDKLVKDVRPALK